MSGGAFRDASAAIERAAMLERENAELRDELADAAKLRIEVEELGKLRHEIEELRAVSRGENEGAYLSRLSEERRELADEVRELRGRLATQGRELERLRRKRNGLAQAVEPALDRLIDFFRRK